MNGWYISFLGHNNNIHLGWYKNNIIHGNWMCLNGLDMSVISSGWYENGIRIKDMKEDHQYKNFSIYDVFYISEYEKSESIRLTQEIRDM